ncbi:serine/threonine protein kinase [Planctomycetales bacterium ZRK34]|nr:serine/threonine protein kinase [Planctomycetales bacterium ZRK34]
MADEHSLNEASAIGRVVVEQGLATADEVRECLNHWKGLGDDARIEKLVELLVDQGVATPRQLERARQQTEVRASSAGDQIPGYKVLQKLGEGAMAKVYKAKQVSLDRIVAIKVLPRRAHEDPQFVERFYAEGRAAAKLNHPNIVQAIDVGQAGGRHYFVMEYVEGESVSEYLQEHKRYSEPDALKVVIQIAEALNHAHERGFIHRDVKPKNIMLTADGTAKLADMGLARQVSDREAAEAESGKAFGTPYYISPEQIRGEVDVDFRCDIYGLGATFYNMVTGRVPFTGKSPSEVMRKHLREAPKPPDHINPDLSAGVSEIIEVMLAKDRKKRYNSTAHLLEDLRSVAEGQAPMQARKTFDMAYLADIEKSSGGEEEMIADADGGAVPLAQQPVFWGLIVSLAMNIILLIAMVMALSR